MAGLEKDPYDFTDRYNTSLSPFEEIAFLKWAKENNALNDLYDYDVRGAYKELMAGTMSKDNRGHLGDKYKKPNHPTFSNESIYNNVDGYVGGIWESLPNGQLIYKASPTNVYHPEYLQQYFNEVEPNVQLILPDK